MGDESEVSGTDVFWAVLHVVAVVSACLAPWIGYAYAFWGMLPFVSLSVAMIAVEIVSQLKALR